jgi:hypothetical protein
MNQKKMQALYIEQTGHILAAFTRTADSQSLLDVKGLAGTDLLVRNAEPKLPSPKGGETLSVPMDLLKAEIVDLNESSFVMPFNFMVGGGQANDLSTADPPATVSTDLLGDAIDIKVKLAVTEETKVWAQVQEKEDASTGSEPIRRIVAGTIKPTTSGIGDGKSVKLDLRTRPDEQPAPIPLKGKTYFVLVLVAGRKPLFFTTK